MDGTVGSGGGGTIVVSQINYAGIGDGYFTFRIEKHILYAAVIATAVLLAFAAIIIWLVSKRKKQDPELRAMYRQMAASDDINEIYDIFNKIIKYRYNISIKASSRSAILNGFPDTGIASRVTDIVDYMESGAEKSSGGLKELIRGAIGSLRHMEI